MSELACKHEKQRVHYKSIDALIIYGETGTDYNFKT